MSAEPEGKRGARLETKKRKEAINTCYSYSLITHILPKTSYHLFMNEDEFEWKWFFSLWIFSVSSEAHN